MSWHAIIIVLQWLIFAVGVFALVRRSGWSTGAILMAGSLAFQAIGGLASSFSAHVINQHQAFWVPTTAWAVSTLAFAAGFLLVCLARREAIQPSQPTPGSGT